MCGIAGLVARRQPLADPQLVERMTGAMPHRGPDASGLWSEGPIALGHRRLSIIDLNEAANQPLADGAGRYRLVFNGEIYNYRELRAQLSGYPFRTQSDTEVLLAAYTRWGTGCLQHLNGMFAFALWDRQTQQLLLARDRMGKKPLYYYLDDQHLLFASEVRALLQTGLVPRRLNDSALPTYLMYQTVPSPDTLVQNVRQIEPGHYALFARDQWVEQPYWDLLQPTPADPVLLSSATAVRAEVRRLMQGAVARRMVSDVPFGAFLSGGVDSSAVVALMAQQSEQPVNTFTISFAEQQVDESAQARQLARRFNTRHTDLCLRPTDLLAELPKLLASMDQPSGDGPNTYMVSKLTKEAGITVALTGLGGDELFAGYSTFGRYARLRQLRWLWQLPEGLRRPVLNTVLRTINPTKRQALIQLPSLAPPRLFSLFRQSFTASEVATLLGPTGANPVADWLTRHDTDLRRLPTLSQVSVSELMSYAMPLLLRDADQMSMAHALELRVPFFDYTLIEFLLQVPDTYKAASPPKRLLVDALRPLLPESVLQRPKMGFSFPWASWLRGDLRAFCQQRLAQLAQRDLFRPGTIEAMWATFLRAEPGSSWNQLWLLVTLDDWLERHGV
ncbi:asparagine synthase (glutamine-hydrolysing) [Fibrella aestuarina BUZ 2]|uniref:asparagine synthase (glutamine-hydrolyzing) n=1 Tax=Fibrella aestuarina BUZ 2 TaxID=1166018 RepID=I0K646_9BACT|nr:asparagine synthase (glutamine-hydrolyzing) [Fibrella aestuarina]CCG99599.1 asparagine synthase (glutamine-hydrolysing) [Fibrella aestuarina BUZ 2]